MREDTISYFFAVTLFIACSKLMLAVHCGWSHKTAKKLAVRPLLIDNQLTNTSGPTRTSKVHSVNGANSQRCTATDQIDLTHGKFLAFGALSGR